MSSREAAEPDADTSNETSNDTSYSARLRAGAGHHGYRRHPATMPLPSG